MTRLDRLYRAIPLALAFLWLVILYGWQTRGHVTPWCGERSTPKDQDP